MRTSRLLLAALCFALVAACTAEPVGVARPDENPAFGVGFSGSGNSAGSDSTGVLPLERCGAGFCGTGN